MYCTVSVVEGLGSKLKATEIIKCFWTTFLNLISLVDLFSFQITNSCIFQIKSCFKIAFCIYFLFIDVDSEPPAKKICNSSSSGPSSSSNKNNLSKHSKKKDTKRKDFNLLNMHSRLKQQADQYALDETEYYFEDGFRKVHPYFFTYHTFCKGNCLMLAVFKNIYIIV